MLKCAYECRAPTLLCLEIAYTPPTRQQTQRRPYTMLCWHPTDALAAEEASKRGKQRTRSKRGSIYAPQVLPAKSRKRYPITGTASTAAVGTFCAFDFTPRPPFE